jgi:hypothetical protein
MLCLAAEQTTDPAPLPQEPTPKERTPAGTSIKTSPPFLICSEHNANVHHKEWCETLCKPPG